MSVPQKWALPLCFAVMQFGGCSNTPASDPAPTEARQPPAATVEASFCELIDDPSRFDGFQVFVTADATAGSHYEIFLSHHHCPPDTIELVVPSTFESAEAVDQFLDEVFAGFPSDSETIQVRLKGRFAWNPSEVPARTMELIEILATGSVARD